MLDSESLKRTREHTQSVSLQDLISYYHSLDWDLRDYKSGIFREYFRHE